MRWDDAIADFEAAYTSGGYSERTLEQYARSLTVFADTLWPDAEPPALEAVNGADIDDFTARRRAAGKATSTIQVERAAIGALMRHAVRRGFIERSPVEDSTPPRFPSSTDDVYRAVTVAEYQAVLASARDGWEKDRRDERRRVEDALLVQLAALAGLRVSEICGLDVLDVDEARVTVRRGKGGKRRLVPTDPDIWGLVGEHRAPRPHLVGMSSDASRRITRNAVELRFAQIGRAAGVPDLHPHALRHFFGTYHAVQADTPLTVLQKMMGHSSRRTTERYLHADETDMRAAIEAANSARSQR